MTHGTIEDVGKPFEPVAFFRSRMGCFQLFLKVAFLCLMFQALVALMLVNAIGYAAPTWQIAGGVIVLIALPPASWALSNLCEPTRLILREDMMQIGGLLLKRTIRYDDVRYLGLDEPDELFTRCALLVIQRKRGGTWKILLLKADAEECFHALRELSPQAAAIEFDQNLYAPLNDDHASDGREALAAALLRKARWNMLLAAAFLVVAGGVVLPMLMMGATLGIRMFITIGLLLVGAVGVGWEAVQQRRLRRSLLSERYVTHPDDVLPADELDDDR